MLLASVLVVLACVLDRSKDTAEAVAAQDLAVVSVCVSTSRSDHEDDIGLAFELALQPGEIVSVGAEDSFAESLAVQ